MMLLLRFKIVVVIVIQIDFRRARAFHRGQCNEYDDRQYHQNAEDNQDKSNSIVDSAKDVKLSARRLLRRRGCGRCRFGSVGYGHHAVCQRAVRSRRVISFDRNVQVSRRTKLNLLVKCRFPDRKEVVVFDDANDRFRNRDSREFHCAVVCDCYARGELPVLLRPGGHRLRANRNIDLRCIHIGIYFIDVRGR
ncbi:hypothetical protein SDC9_99799 [bioreactor metagenome]|uniref:Uncharacterized protein n=1 Tax=bioreactor metagenome TaxID=1076179 RepID=A0A645AIJ7_9ZZZZ